MDETFAGWTCPAEWWTRAFYEWCTSTVWVDQGMKVFPSFVWQAHICVLHFRGTCWSLGISRLFNFLNMELVSIMLGCYALIEVWLSAFFWWTLESKHLHLEISTIKSSLLCLFLMTLCINKDEFQISRILLCFRYWFAQQLWHGE